MSADLSARLVAEGHDKVNFAIVAAGENAASPHHHAGPRVIDKGDIVLCDFGGTMDGYCSDITRCVHLGPPPPDIAEAYAVLHEAQRAGVAAGTVGVPCEEVDRAARRIIDDAGYGRYRAPHRPRDRHGGARGPVHGRRQHGHAGGRPRAAWSPASTYPGDGACASRTSSSPRPAGPSPSTTPTTRWSCSTSDRIQRGRSNRRDHHGVAPGRAGRRGRPRRRNLVRMKVAATGLLLAPRSCSS